MKRITISTLVVIGLAVSAAAASESADTLPHGTPIDVTVALPVDGTEFVGQPDGVTVDVAGTASVGVGPGDATWVYVLDVSGSVNNAANAGCGDRNNDGLVDRILDCEIAALVALNDVAAASGSVDEVGVALYGEFGGVADMAPSAGIDPTTDPAAGPGDVATVLTSVVARPTFAGPTEFTPVDVSRGGTNFSVGLAAATEIINAAGSATNIVVFLSDGGSNEGAATFDANLAALATTGATVHSFAIGAGSSCAGGQDGTLGEIAAATNGSCAEVADPSELAAVVSGLLQSSLDELRLTVDGGAESAIANADISATLPATGPIAVDYSTPVAGLGLGTHTFCVTAFGHDGGGDGDSGAACATVHIYDIDLVPPTATKELALDTMHTVTAVIGGDPSKLQGRSVAFEVIDGPNIGQAGQGTTAPDGTVSWTVTSGGVGGVDTIRACFTVAVPTGQTACDNATVEWVDTTPPVAACMPGPNPHGKKIPPAGSSTLPGPKGGQNEDGFYDLQAEDAVDPALDVFVVDQVTGHVFGPYAPDTVVKWTQAPGAEPAEKPIGSTRGQAGAVAWHLTGQGDMTVYATDASGNASDPVICLVPPFPK